MDINQYRFVVTSANDYDFLSLECTDESRTPPLLVLEAGLKSYKDRVVTVTQYVNDLPLEVVEEFVRRARMEIERGDQNGAT